MDKLDIVKKLLAKIKMPNSQQSPLCCYTLLALARLKQETSWHEATNEWTRIHDIIVFTSENYSKTYAENSRETIRKQAMHHFRTAALIEDNGQATNSPNYRYRLTSEFLKVIRSLEDNSTISDAIVR